MLSACRRVHRDVDVVRLIFIDMTRFCARVGYEGPASTADEADEGGLGEIPYLEAEKR